jgi:putative acetyltransferase
MLIDIRRERPDDISRIYTIEAAAFEGEAHARLVDRLRADDALILSQVAEIKGEIVGHAAYSFVTVTDGDKVRRFPALGPIAVSPPLQRQGIGSALVRAGLRALAEAGYALVFLVGSPNYYPRFGYQPAQPLGFTSDYVKQGGRHEHFMLAILDETMPGEARGHVRFHPAFAEVD